MEMPSNLNAQSIMSASQLTAELTNYRLWSKKFNLESTTLIDPLTCSSGPLLKIFTQQAYERSYSTYSNIQTVKGNKADNRSSMGTPVYFTKFKTEVAYNYNSII